MINKSYPIRHRLVTKTAAVGTVLEGKPYVGRWARALSALGMSFSGTVLFANHVLLTEGDSDPIYLNAILQKFIEVGKLASDLNSFAAIATGKSADADALIRILVESQPVPHLAVLVDGDKSGRDRISYIQRLLEKHKISSKVLREGTTIEDYLPNLGDVFVEAVASYVQKIAGDMKHGLDTSQVNDSVRKSFESRFGEDASPKGVAAWIEDEVTNLASLTSPPSKVGIAREYATLLQDLPAARFRTGSAGPHLVKWIAEALSLPVLGDVEPRVLADRRN
jgi:predicted ATP-dependent endonuclease of OLD family